MDLHCTAQGKALICHFSEAELGKLFQYRGFARYTPKTIGSLKDLIAELSDARVRGYTVNNEEHTLGIVAVAAPVFNHVSKVVAAASVRWTTTHQMVFEPLPRIASQVIATAREISRHFM